MHWLIHLRSMEVYYLLMGLDSVRTQAPARLPLHLVLVEQPQSRGSGDG